MEESKKIIEELKEYLIGEESDQSHILKEKILTNMVEESYKLTDKISKQERLEFVCASYFLFIMHDAEEIQDRILDGQLEELKKELLEEFAAKTEIPDTLKGEVAVHTIEENLDILEKQFKKQGE